MKILPIAFMGKSRPLNNTANLYAASIKAQEEGGDTFVKRAAPIENPINKKQVVTPKSERTCKNIATATSLVCGAISAASGKAETFSPGAWALRGTQALMFILMSMELDIPIYVAFEYAATEYMSGAYLGCEGSKIVVAATGCLADAITGGTSIPASEGMVRGINGGLSAAITKKMGNGFVKQVKNGKMNGLDQAIRLSGYLTSRLTAGYFANNSKLSDLTDVGKIKDIFTTGFSTNTIGDLQDTNKVKAILESTPEMYKELSAQIVNYIIYRDVPKAIVLFMEEMSSFKLKESVLKRKLKKQYGIEIEIFNEKAKQQMIKQALMNSFITSAVYEIFDITQSALITKEAVDTVIDISENIHNYPEAFKIFEEYQDELMKNYNLGKISSDAFVNQFKNTAFLHNISYLTSRKVKEFARTWTRKENAAKSRKKAEQQEQTRQESSKTKQYEQKSENLSRQNAENIKQAAAHSEKIKENLNRVNAFGYSKIAGYDEEKGFLKAYLNSLSSVDSCDSEDLLNSVLFYGPRGNGKTTFASALAEEFGCRFRKVEITSNKEKALKRLEKELNKAKESWETNKRNSIVLIDECTAFMNEPKNQTEEEINARIGQLIQESASKYHTMLFLTTNYPMRLDKIFTDEEKMPLFMPLNPPGKENALEVFKYYAAGSDIDFNKVIDTFERQCQAQQARYSNGQIKNIVELTKMKNDGKINTEGLLDSIRQTRPEISQEDLKRFKSDKEAFFRR